MSSLVRHNQIVIRSCGHERPRCVDDVQRRPEGKMYERILTVLDATPNAQAVLAQSLYLARLAEVSVHVLHVHSVRAMHAALPIVAAPVAGVPMLGVPPADMAVGAQAQW